MVQGNRFGFASTGLPGSTSVDSDVLDTLKFANTKSGDLSTSTQAARPRRNMTYDTTKSNLEDAVQAMQSIPDENYLTQSFGFCAVVAFIVVAHMEFLILEVDYSCFSGHCPKNLSLWPIVNHIFTALFVIEILIRIVTDGPRRYFVGAAASGSKVNVVSLVDLTLVLLRVLDTWVLAPAGIQAALRFASVFRIFQVTPFIKALSLVPAFRELYLIVSNIAEIIKTLLWVLMLLAIAIWIFAIFLTLAVGQEDENQFDFSQSDWSKDDCWGTVPRSCYSLFQVVTKDKWASHLAKPLVERQHALILLFLIFIWITSVALMNTIVGIVVESILSTARANEEAMAKSRDEFDMKVLASLQKVFHEADVDGSGALDKEELTEALKKPAIRDRMKLLNIPMKDLEMLFQMLDLGDKGSILIDQFFRASVRLRGPAKSSDLHHLSVDIARSINWFSDANELGGKIVDNLKDLLEVFECMELEVVQGSADSKDPVLESRRFRRKIKVAARAPKEESIKVDRTFAEQDELNQQLALNSHERDFANPKHDPLRAAALTDTPPQQVQLWQPPAVQPAPPPLPLHMRQQQQSRNPRQSAMAMLRDNAWSSDE